MKKDFILGIAASNIRLHEALEFIIKGLENRTEKLTIVTPNPEIIMFAQKDKSFKQIVNSADLALPDGIGVVWGAKMLGKQLQERITGVDFMEMLCKEAVKRGFTVGFLGGGPKIAEAASECLRLRYPGLKIAFAVEEWDQVESNYRGTTDHRPQTTANERAKSAVDRRQRVVDILFVAFGFPKQEKWIYDNLPKINVKAAMAVGGAFDYISGAVPRAPLFVRNIGLEWLFRLIVQPWRLRRQLSLIQFIFLVLKERFSSKSS